MSNPKCNRCKTEMIIGQALVNPLVYADDFGNDAGQYGTTISPDLSQAELKPVWKCPECGYSKKISCIEAHILLTSKRLNLIRTIISEKEKELETL